MKLKALKIKIETEAGVFIDESINLDGIEMSEDAVRKAFKNDTDRLDMTWGYRRSTYKDRK